MSYCHQTEGYQHKKDHESVEQNRESINKHYSQLIYNKVGKNIQWRENSLFSKWCWESWATSYKSRKSEHSLTSYAKSKWFQDFKYKTQHHKNPIGGHSKTFSDINHTNVF